MSNVEVVPTTVGVRLERPIKVSVISTDDFVLDEAELNALERLNEEGGVELHYYDPECNAYRSQFSGTWGNIGTDYQIEEVVLTEKEQYCDEIARALLAGSGWPLKKLDTPLKARIVDPSVLHIPEGFEHRFELLKQQDVVELWYECETPEGVPNGYATILPGTIGPLESSELGNQAYELISE